MSPGPIRGGANRCGSACRSSIREGRYFSPTARGHFGFDTFSESYCGQLDEAYLHDPGLKQWVEQELPHLGDATLLCFERQGEPCHRLVLARWLKGKQPTLELGELR